MNASLTTVTGALHMSTALPECTGLRQAAGPRRRAGALQVRAAGPIL